MHLTGLGLVLVPSLLQHNYCRPHNVGLKLAVWSMRSGGHYAYDRQILFEV
jgi:hypothetical protein